MHDILYELVGTNGDGGSWKFTSSRLDEILSLQQQIGGTLGCNQPRAPHCEPNAGVMAMGQQRAFARLWGRLRSKRKP